MTCTETVTKTELIELQNLVKALKLDSFRFNYSLELFGDKSLISYSIDVLEMNKLNIYRYPEKIKKLSFWKRLKNKILGV